MAAKFQPVSSFRQWLSAPHLAGCSVSWSRLFTCEEIHWMRSDLKLSFQITQCISTFRNVRCLSARCFVYHSRHLCIPWCCSCFEVGHNVLTSASTLIRVDIGSGVMRITVTVVVIMFELTGALTYILPTMVSTPQIFTTLTLYLYRADCPLGDQSGGRLVGCFWYC